jgi:CheY-like chemotaxis protein
LEHHQQAIRTQLKLTVMRILYADDDSDDGELLIEALETIDPSIECHLANDGKHAIQMLTENEDLPDYIFLDVNMPVMDGKNCLRELKKDHRLRDIPVIIYSTTRDEDEISALYELGATGFLPKPNSFAQLCSALERMILKLKSERLYST